MLSGRSKREKNRKVANDYTKQFLPNIRVYCKADAFPFRVVTMPFLESNLDRAVCYRVFYGQVVRFQRLCTYRESRTRTRYLLDILKDRGYKLGLLDRQFSRAVAKYIVDFQIWELPQALSVDPVARIVESVSKLTLLTQFRVEIDTFV